MNIPLKILSASGSAQQPSGATTNPAVARCFDAWKRAHSEAVADGEDDFNAGQNACEAYRVAMPALSGPENIRDFIACVAHAMLICVIDIQDGTRLLYAAQVARAALQGRTAKQKAAAE